MAPLDSILPFVFSNICVCGSSECSRPFGECHCGCGNKTPLATVTVRKRRHVKGMPVTFCYGHNRRMTSYDSDPPFYVDGQLCRHIKLTRDHKAIVDARNYDRIAKLKWRASKTRSGTVYACHQWLDLATRKMRTIHMHTLIKFPNAMESTEDFPLVDHKFGNGLDNREAVIREASVGDNHKNKVVRRDSSTGYKGVSLPKGRTVYVAQIFVNKKLITILRTRDLLEAAHAYDDAARRYFGDFACVNFPLAGERGARLNSNGDVAERPAAQRGD